ncbi:hydrogenase expression/formation protein HypE [bacterium]|nr:hydrogenase expression/formation protein HypE [bacterium]
MEFKKHIRLIDGEGGRATTRLIKELFIHRFNNPILSELCDSASMELGREKISFTTDAFVVDPSKFPGGDIGKLSICGTVNDLAALGAKPIMIAAAFILEEGLALIDLEHYVDSMALAAKKSGVNIVAGDTKVVPKGKGDKIYITTSGVGLIKDFPRMPALIQPGDSLVISGDIARHAASVVAAREGLLGDPPIESDCAPLWNMVKEAVDKVPQIHAMRDPTRGGLGGILNELASQSGNRFVVNESDIPILPQIYNMCELFGYEPLFMACEGRMLFIVQSEYASDLINVLKSHAEGTNSAIIGHVEKGEGVVLRTPSGGKRLLIEPEGAPLPRIC